MNVLNCDENENSYFDEAICNAECEFECYSQDLEWVDYIVLGDDGSVTFGGNGEEFDTGETWGTYNGQFCVYNPGDEEHDEYYSEYTFYCYCEECEHEFEHYHTT